MYAQMMVVEAIQYTTTLTPQVFIACTMNSCVQFNTPKLSMIRMWHTNNRHSACVHVNIPLGTCTSDVKMLPHHMQIL